MKKMIVAALMAALLVTATACGSTSSSSSSSSSSESSTSSQSSSVESEPAEEASNADGGEVSTVTGVIEDAAMNSVVIKTEDGLTLNFTIPDDADKTEVDGMTIGDTLEITYTGTIDGEDSSGAVVTKLVQTPASGESAASSDAAASDASAASGDTSSSETPTLEESTSSEAAA